MNRKTLSLLTVLALTATQARSDELDLYAPAWRGGWYSVQNGWNWPSEPGDLLHLPPATSVVVNGSPPLTLQSVVAGGSAAGSVWVANSGRPGLMSFGSAYFVFSRWSDPNIGPDPQPATIRVQFTFDGPAPLARLESAPLSTPQWFYPDPHHAYFDQDIQYLASPVLLMRDANPQTVLHEVRIDTILAPEPGALSLLGLSALAARRRR